MRYLGVEFQSDQTVWVAITMNGNDVSVVDTGFIKIGGTKLVTDIVQYKEDLAKLFSEYPVARIAIKDKPETGRMRAGAAAMKMEAVFLLTAPVEVKFLSAKAVAKAMELATGVKEKYKDAYRAAVALSKTA